MSCAWCNSEQMGTNNADGLELGAAELRDRQREGQSSAIQMAIIRGTSWSMKAPSGEQSDRGDSISGREGDRESRNSGELSTRRPGVLQQSTGGDAGTSAALTARVRVRQRPSGVLIHTGL